MAIDWKNVQKRFVDYKAERKSNQINSLMSTVFGDNVILKGFEVEKIDNSHILVKKGIAVVDNTIIEFTQDITLEFGDIEGFVWDTDIALYVDFTRQELISTDPNFVPAKIKAKAITSLTGDEPIIGKLRYDSGSNVLYLTSYKNNRFMGGLSYENLKKIVHYPEEDNVLYTIFVSPTAGEYGDGSENNPMSFERALEKTKEPGSYKLVFYPGTYNVNGELILNYKEFKGILLISKTFYDTGSNDASQWHDIGNYDVTIITERLALTNNTQCFFHGIAIETTSNIEGIYLDGNSNIHVRALYVKCNNAYFGINLNNNSSLINNEIWSNTILIIENATNAIQANNVSNLSLKSYLKLRNVTNIVQIVTNGVYYVDNVVVETGSLTNTFIGQGVVSSIIFYNNELFVGTKIKIKTNELPLPLNVIGDNLDPQNPFLMTGKQYNSSQANTKTTYLNAYNKKTNEALPSGFYDYDNTGGLDPSLPTNQWYNILNVRHSNSLNNYGFQILRGHFSGDIFFRYYDNNTYTTRRLITDIDYSKTLRLNIDLDTSTWNPLSYEHLGGSKIPNREHDAYFTIEQDGSYKCHIALDGDIYLNNATKTAAYHDLTNVSKTDMQDRDIVVEGDTRGPLRSSYYVQGQNSSRTVKLNNYGKTPDDILPSGFYEWYGTIDGITTTWLIEVISSSYQTSIREIAYKYNDSIIKYERTYRYNSWDSWIKILYDVNTVGLMKVYARSADLGLPNTFSWNLVSENGNFSVISTISNIPLTIGYRYEITLNFHMGFGDGDTGRDVKIYLHDDNGDNVLVRQSLSADYNPGTYSGSISAVVTPLLSNGSTQYVYARMDGGAATLYSNVPSNYTSYKLTTFPTSMVIKSIKL